MPCDQWLWKTGGLIQLEELGVLESPIALTNTLCVGTVQQALVRYMLQDHPEIGYDERHCECSGWGMQ